ncbi:MAG: AMP-binding protein, partial [Rhodospirillales bacterium]|nr:AMP-binding protein [Rhodospirillales bacterium]
MLVGDLLASNARRLPDAPAWTFEGETWSWAQANRRINRLANALSAMGFQSQDRVAILAGNSNHLAELYFALAKADLVAVPVNPRSVAREIDFAIDQVDARALLVSAGLTGRLEGMETDFARFACTVGMGEGHGMEMDYETLLAGAGDSEPLADFPETNMRAFKFTSGTTGAPKGVISTHRQYLFTVANYVMQQPYDETDRGLIALPLSAGVAVQILTAYCYRACPCTILPRFDAAQVLDTIEAEGTTRLFAVPTVIITLIEEQLRKPRDLSSVKLIEYGGSPASIGLMRRATEVLGVPFAQVFGSSETGGLISFMSPEEHKKIALGLGNNPPADDSSPMPCGREAQGYHIRVVDDEDRDVGPGEVGEMIVKCVSLMSGYWNQPELTADALRDGWLYTGDLARRDGDGMLYIVDRKRDMIITGGINVYSAEV